MAIRANIASLGDAQSVEATNLATSLNLILAWVNMHSKILERYESQAYFGYEFFVRSNVYSTSFLSILGLNLNADDQNSQSIFSISGV